MSEERDRHPGGTRRLEFPRAEVSLPDVAAAIEPHLEGA